VAVEVAVVGAGPAGVAAALTLRRAGRDVVLVDKAQFPRDKYCGDGLTAAALNRYEELGLDTGRIRDQIPSWTVVDRCALRSPSGRWVDLPLPSGGGIYAVAAKRIELDAAFLHLARDEGVEVLEASRLSSVHDDDDRLVLELDGARPTTLEAHYLIGADGMWSPSRRMLGAEVRGYRGDWHAFRQYYTDVAPRAASEFTVWFEPDIMPGYIWSFPLGDGRVNIGFGIERAGPWNVRDMKALWPDLLSRPQVRDVLGPDARPEDDHRAWPIPSRVASMPLGAGRALWAGDAAAAVDPMTGEGIAQALDTGTWAARAVLDHGEAGPAAVRADYERSVRLGLYADHRMSALLVRGLGNRRAARAAFRLVGRTPWTRRNFGRWLWEDYPRAIVATPRRWSPTMFAGGGGAFTTPDPTTAVQ
jgi:geranylgeranyl reductase family protein